MATEIIEQMEDKGWRSGLFNLIKKNTVSDRGRRFWATQILLWTLLTTGVASLILFFPMPDELLDGTAQSVSALMTFFTITGGVVALFLPVFIQGVIVDEVQSGTASWVASKPISRTAFILAKLIANSLAFILIIVVLQGIIAYPIFVFSGAPVEIGRFIIASNILILVVLYFISFSIMLGAVFNKRSIAMGGPIGLFFGGQILSGFVPQISNFLPLILSDYASIIALGYSATNAIFPIIACSLQVVIFIGLAIWSFKRREL